MIPVKIGLVIDGSTLWFGLRQLGLLYRTWFAATTRYDASVIGFRVRFR